MGRQNSRRDFLKQSSMAGLGFWVAGGVASADTKTAAKSGKVNIACIGVGGKGDSDSDQAGEVGNIVAICDIDDKTLDKKAAKFPSAKRYNDYRKMLEEMDKQIDAVTVSTPDHTHAPASLMAMRMKKAVYCQKPLTHTVAEARSCAKPPPNMAWPRRWATRAPRRTAYAGQSKSFSRAPSGRSTKPTSGPIVPSGRKPPG